MPGSNSEAAAHAQPQESAIPQAQSSASASDTHSNATEAAQASQQAQQQQQERSDRQHPASESRRDASTDGNGRNGDGRRRRRQGRPAISPAVTMALGSLLQSTVQGDAYRDPQAVLTNAAQLLLNSHSFEGGANRQRVLVGQCLITHLAKHIVHLASDMTGGI